MKDLITRKPLEGWDEDPAAIKALLKSDPEALQMWNDEMKGKHGGDRKSEQAKIKTDNVRLDYGNAKAHTLDVLKRKAPEKFKAVCNGELSANAAMIAAGQGQRWPLRQSHCTKPRRRNDEKKPRAGRK